MKDHKTLRLVASFFKDSKGNIITWQWPNIPIIGWLVFKILSMVTDGHIVKVGFEYISTAFLFTWAYLEITSGDSRFRQLLGAIVLIIVIFGFFHVSN